MKRAYHPTAGLWWLALCIGAVGSTVSVLLWLDRLHTLNRSVAGLVMAATVVGVGLCVIAATAEWWLKR